MSLGSVREVPWCIPGKEKFSSSRWSVAWVGGAGALSNPIIGVSISYIPPSYCEDWGHFSSYGPYSCGASAGCLRAHRYYTVLETHR